MVLGVSYLGGIANGIATGRVRGRGVNDERLVDQRPECKTSRRKVAAPDRTQKTESETWMAGSV